MYFLRESNKFFKGTDIKLIQDFRNFLKDLPKEDRTIWRDVEFIGQLDKLSELRNGGAHINDKETSVVKGVHALLIDKDKPGVLLRAFGCFSD